MDRFCVAAALLAAASWARAEPATIRVTGTDLGVADMWGRSSVPTLTDGKTTIRRGGPGAIALPPGRRLAELRFRARPRDGEWRLLIDAREGHHYEVHPDPCCYLAIEDLDSDLRPEARATPRCVTAGGECGDGLANVPSWIARDPRCADGEHTCVGVTRVRFDVSRAALRAGPIEVFVEDRDAPEWTLSLDGDRILIQRRDQPRAALAAAEWQEWPWWRETSPARVILRRAGAAQWERAVQLRLEHRYTIHVTDDPAASEILRDD